jgi:hypothetical protein
VRQQVCEFSAARDAVSVGSQRKRRHLDDDSASVTKNVEQGWRPLSDAVIGSSAAVNTVRRIG